MTDTQIVSLLTQLPFVALMFFLFINERNENKKLVEQYRADSMRHEEQILRIVASMSKCAAIPITGSE